MPLWFLSPLKSHCRDNHPPPNERLLGHQPSASSPIVWVRRALLGLLCLRLLSPHLPTVTASPCSVWVNRQLRQPCPLESPCRESSLGTGKRLSVCLPRTQLLMGLGGCQQHMPLRTSRVESVDEFHSQGSAAYCLPPVEPGRQANQYLLGWVTARRGWHRERAHACLVLPGLLLQGAHSVVKKEWSRRSEFSLWIRCHSEPARDQPLFPAGFQSQLKAGGWAVELFALSFWPGFLRVGAAPKGKGLSAIWMGMGTLVCMWPSPEPLK